MISAGRRSHGLAAARGENVLPPELASGLVSEIRLRASNDAPVLTKRESEILRLIASGKSLPEIAGELYLGVTTVKTHVQHLYEKLGDTGKAHDCLRSGSVRGSAAPRSSSSAPVTGSRTRRSAGSTSRLPSSGSGRPVCSRGSTSARSRPDSR